tara:strand:- start:1626 stop:3524 length:1899 start_codon:yes stop_codon:yes gene_type:complete
MDKLDVETPNFTDKNIQKLKELFPNCVTEDSDGQKIDFDLLKQELSGNLVEGNEERYQLSWPGKAASIAAANSSISKTLRPNREESKDFDNTKNLYIEGDNLEVLKLLQETYLRRVKMIYIDPPYNTGKDFVYKDNFTQDKAEYDEESGNVDDEGGRLITNPDSNGRYHSDWLSMMYPRLKLAKNLLKDDGVIFISIDENEIHNLRKICDEIFGYSNFVADLIWRKKTGASDSKGFSIVTENILVYTKSLSNLDTSLTRNKNSFDPERYKHSDEHEERRGKYYPDNLDRGGIQYSDSMNYPIECPDGSITYPNGRTEFKNDGWIWTWGKDKLEWGLQKGFIEFKKSKSKESGWGVYYKNYVHVNNKDELTERSAPHKNLILDIINTEGTAEMSKLFSKKVFQYSKPSNFMKELISYVNLSNEDIVLDFFSGSATTAHAIMKLNSEDNINRKFILVQIPEETDEKSEAYKAEYKTIAEIGKERIRRAGKQVTKDTGNTNLDTGFRVFKVDSSNMKDVYFTPDETNQADILELASNIKDDRSSEDLLFMVLLRWGIDLSSKIERKEIAGKEVFFVDDNYLAACFDEDIDENFIKVLVDEKPLKVILQDSSFASSSVKINVEQIFVQANIEGKVI